MATADIRSRYQPQRKLGMTGSRTEVWLAQDLARDCRHVVLKKIVLPFRRSEEPRKLLTLCDSYLNLSHPGIARHLDFCSGGDPDSIWLVTELVVGCPILPTLRTLTADELFPLINHFCATLYYLHSRGYAHLDLHPGNVFLLPPANRDEPWGLKLIDIPIFPLANLQHAPGLVTFNKDFSAPEVIGRGQFDHRADLYSLGCILFTAIVGDPPPKPVLQDKRIQNRSQTTEDLFEDISPTFLATVVRKLLDTSPNRRFASAYYILEDLHNSMREMKHLPTLPLAPETLDNPVVFVSSSGFNEAISVLDSWLTTEPPRELLELGLAGLPGSGRNRTARALLLYLTINNCPEVILHRDGASNLLLLASEFLLPNEAPSASHNALAILLSNSEQHDDSNVRGLLPTSNSDIVLLTCLSTGFGAIAPQPEPHNKSDAQRIHISPLGSSECSLLIDHLLHKNDIDQATKDAIINKALYLPGLIAETIKQLVRTSVICKRGALWTILPTCSLEDSLPNDVLLRFRHSFDNLPKSDLDLLSFLCAAQGYTPMHLINQFRSERTSSVQESLDRLEFSGLIQIKSGNVFIASATVEDLVVANCGENQIATIAQTAFLILGSTLSTEGSDKDALLAKLAERVNSQHNVMYHALRASCYFESMNLLEEALSFCKLAVKSITPSTYLSNISILEKCLVLLDQTGHTDEFNEMAKCIEEILPDDAHAERVRLYALLAWYHSDRLEFRKSTRFAARAISTAKTSGLMPYISSSLSVLAQNQLRQGRARAAISIIKAALAFATPEHFNPEQARSISIIAGAYYMEGDYVEALAHARHAFRYACAHPSRRNVLTSSNNIGILLMESGQLKEASRTLHKCRMRGTSCGEFRSISISHSNLVLLNTYNGELERAALHAKEVFRLLSQSGSQYGQVQSLLTLAEAQLLRGSFTESLGNISIAEVAATHSGDVINVLLALLQRGWALLHLGDCHSALESFRSAESQLDPFEYRVHQASCSLGMAAIEIALGLFNSARQRLESILGKLPHQHMVSELQFHIIRGRLHLAVGDLALARRDFTFAAALARSRGFRPFAFESLLALAQCALSSGDLDDARRTLRRLVGLNRRLKYRVLEPWLHVALADYAAASGNAWEQKRHLLNGRTCLLELSHNIHDPGLRNHFLNRPDSQALLQRSEDVEELLHSGLAHPVESSIPSSALESIARINEQMYGRDSLKSTLGLIIDEALHLTGAERGIIFLFDPTGREELKVAKNLGRRSLVEARKYTRTALRQIRDGETVYAADTLTDPKFNSVESITHHHIRSVACVPLRSRHSIIGALYLDSHRAGLSANPNLLKSLQIFAQQAAVALERSIRYFHVTEENRRLRESVRLDRTNLIGHGGYFTRIKQLIAAAGMTDLPVLILGESGTGKELVARSIHESEKTRLKPFLSVDCGALPENLVESELFGYRKGAFTGADTDKEGLFVSAGNGTLFLDEIANTSLALQAKLLRAIQEREIRPLGSTISVPFRARILAATNGDLLREAREGRFRQDLLFRLNGLSIEVPPLRDRKGDIPLLISHFLQKASIRSVHRVRRISDEALQALMRYDWPGNVRELENCIERAVVLALAGTILLEDLPDVIRSSAIVSWSEKKGEQRLIEEALRRFGGDKTRSASYIGWNRQKLYRKMVQYNIPRDFGRRNTA